MVQGVTCVLSCTRVQHLHVSIVIETGNLISECNPSTELVLAVILERVNFVYPMRAHNRSIQTHKLASALGMVNIYMRPQTNLIFNCCVKIHRLKLETLCHFTPINRHAA